MSDDNVLSFDNTDDLMAFFEEQRRIAESVPVAPWQQALKPGDFIVLDCMQSDGLIIYGEIINLVSPGEPELPTYRIGGRFYSVACVEGELGTHHRASVTLKVDPELFTTLREAGWPNASEVLVVIAAIQREREAGRN